MPLKKIVKQQQPQPQPQPRQSIPESKSKIKAQQIPPLEEIDEEDEEDEIEIEEPRKKLPVARVARMAEEEEETVKKPKKGNLSALAKAFASVPLSGNAQGIRAGVHEAVLRSIVLQPADTRGQSVRLNCDLCSPEFENSNQVADWRMLMNRDGEPVFGGIRVLQQDLAKLGYDMPEADEDFDDNLSATFDAINKDKPGVLIKVTYQTANGVEYMHYTIQGECDNDVVQEYKENNPY